MTNMTYAEAINIAIVAIGDSNAEATDRLKALTAQLAKRGSKGGQTKTQKANEVIKGVIREILEQAQDFLTMDMVREDERLGEYSTQKLGAILGQMVKADEVTKVVHKKKTFYAIKGVEWDDGDEDVEDVEA